MMLKKRPCKICGRWFRPDSRLKDRQKTCGNPKCRDEWHRRQCARWNKKNKPYFQANYLQKLIERFFAGLPKKTLPAESPPCSHPGKPPNPTEKHPSTKRHAQDHPPEWVKDLIRTQISVIIEYIIGQVVRRCARRGIVSG